MYGYIYKITNKINGMMYIGQHKSSSIYDKYIGSGLVLKRAVDKYGIENFQKEILSVVESKYQADIEEIYYIKLFRNAFGEQMLYNIADGGQGGDYSKFWSEEYKNRKGEITKKLWTPEFRKESSERMKETNKNLDRKAIAEKKRGSKMTEESKERMRKAHKGLGCSKVICLETGIIYDSIKSAAEALNIYESGISLCCSGKYKHCKGLHFEYYNKNNNK